MLKRINVVSQHRESKSNMTSTQKSQSCWSKIFMNLEWSSTTLYNSRIERNEHILKYFKGKILKTLFLHHYFWHIETCCKNCSQIQMETGIFFCPQYYKLYRKKHWLWIHLCTQIIYHLKDIITIHTRSTFSPFFCF